MEFESFDENVTLTDEFFANYMDKEKQMDRWMLTGSPTLITISLVLYLLVVFSIGPRYMKNRRPLEMKNLMRLYNIVQVIYNGTLIYYFLKPIAGYYPIPLLFQVSCTLPKPFEGMDELKQAYMIACWHVLLLKNIDLLDTVFMVLRKKDSHVTFLHVYHHAGMVLFLWYSMVTAKPIQACLPVFVNLNVHAIMYAYYFLATFDSLKKYLWWKRYLTRLQLTQFVMILAYIFTLYLRQCQVSHKFFYIWAFNVFFIMCLFLNFYRKAYTNKQKVQDDSEKKAFKQK